VMVALARDKDGGTDLCAPAVGVFTPAVGPGAFVSEGQLLGHLEIVGRRRRVVTPPVAGAVRLGALARGPVEYGQPLCHATAAATADAEADVQALEDDLPPGSRAVRAPIDGMFFAAPSPDEPPFVEIGARISAGQVVGLVEVMKFFYEIHAEGVAGTVVRIDAASNEVIAAGDAVVWVAP
jgi:acetyl-CoA carboxylase biotin carboxyl carrier protein